MFEVPDIPGINVPMPGTGAILGDIPGFELAEFLRPEEVTHPRGYVPPSVKSMPGYIEKEPKWQLSPTPAFDPLHPLYAAGPGSDPNMEQLEAMGMGPGTSPSQTAGDYPYLGPGERGETTQRPFDYQGPGDRPGDPVSDTTVAQALKGQDVLAAGIGPMMLIPALIGGVSALLGGGAALDVVGGVTAGAIQGKELEKAIGGEQAMTTGIQGVPISGPGVPEPPQYMVARQWSIAVNSKEAGTFRVYFFKLIDGRMMSYNPWKKEWKIWRPKKHVVISNNPRMSQIRKLENLYDRTIRKLAKKSRALKLAK